MNVAERYRDTLDELTLHRPGGPALADVLARGRRARRVRRTLAAGGAVAAMTLTGIGGAWLQRPHEIVAVDPFASSPTYRDFVPGTDVDDTIQATVAAHLAGVPDADQVYPSDWNRDTALPDSEAQNATDWQSHYVLGPHESLEVSMFKAIPGDPAVTRCRPSMDVPGLACSATAQADGSTLLHYGVTLGSYVRFVTERVAADGSCVQAFDNVEADSWSRAETRASLVQGQAEALVNDPAMTFPDPQVTPPPPNGR